MHKPIFDFEDERRAERAVSRHELRRYAAGELDEARRAEIGALLESDTSLQAELAELEAADRAFRSTMPFDRFLADHEARVAQRSALAPVKRWLSRFRWQAGGLIAATTAALLLLVFLPERPTPPKNLLKGDEVRVGFFVREAEGARVGVDGERLQAGDQIQFAVRDDEESRSMVLLGIDGHGNVTTYVAAPLPEKGNEKGDGAHKPRLLEQSLVLDDAVGPERFFVVYGREAPAELASLAERAARELLEGGADLARAERLPLDEEHAQSSVHIVKIAP